MKSNKTERSRKLWSIFSGLENMFTRHLPPPKTKITLFNERDDQKDPCRNEKNKEHSDLNPGAQSKNVSATNLIKKCIEVAILEMTGEGREKLKEITRLENIDYSSGSNSDTRKERERVERLKTIREQIFFNYLAPSELLKIFSLYHLINHSNRDAIYQCDRDKASHHWKLFNNYNYKYDPTPFDGSSLLESISYVDYDKVNTLPVAKNYYYSYCTLEEKYGKKGLEDQASIIKNIIENLQKGDGEGKAENKDSKGDELLTMEEELAILLYSSKFILQCYPKRQRTLENWINITSVLISDNNKHFGLVFSAFIVKK